VGVATSALRDTILQTAVDHVAAHGPDSLSFRRLASDAGVSHQAPYHHFEDRRGIFRAIALEGFTLLGEALRSSEKSSDGQSSGDLLEGYVGFALDNPGHFRVMFRRDLCEIESAPELGEVADATFDVLLDHVRRKLGLRSRTSGPRPLLCGRWPTDWQR
jgi:AcrR family transcriptional regulator